MSFQLSREQELEAFEEKSQKKNIEHAQQFQ